MQHQLNSDHNILLINIAIFEYIYYIKLIINSIASIIQKSHITIYNLNLFFISYYDRSNSKL